MAEYEKRIREILRQEQCKFVRHGKGDHDIWYSPVNGRTFSVPVKIKSRHMANVILKQRDYLIGSGKIRIRWGLLV